LVEMLERSGERRRALPTWIALPVVFATGAAAVVVARLLRALVSDGELAGHNATAMMGSDFLVALGLTWLATRVLALRGNAVMLTQVLGVMVMLGLMHDLVHAAPRLWTVAFSRDWVLSVLTTTEPVSVLVKGISYRL
jgi:hypothetical protein